MSVRLADKPIVDVKVKAEAKAVETLQPKAEPKPKTTKAKKK